MTATKLKAILVAGALAGAACGDALADAAAPAKPDAAAAAAAPVKPWVKTKDATCDWWLSREDGHSLRAAIGADWENVSLTFGDPIFNTWPEAGYPKVELRFNRDPKRRVKTQGWATHGQGFAMFGINLTPEAMKKMGGATTVELIRHGKTVITLPLAETPSADELIACIPPPSTGHSDSE
jgi:hypothetical protein